MESIKKLCKKLTDDVDFEKTKNKLEEYIKKTFFSFKPTKKEQEAVSSVHFYNITGKRTVDDDKKWKKIEETASMAIERKSKYYNEVLAQSEEFAKQEHFGEMGGVYNSLTASCSFLTSILFYGCGKLEDFLTRVLALVKLYESSNSIYNKNGVIKIKTRINEYFIKIIYKKNELEICIVASKILDGRWKSTTCPAYTNITIKLNEGIAVIETGFDTENKKIDENDKQVISNIISIINPTKKSKAKNKKKSKPQLVNLSNSDSWSEEPKTEKKAKKTTKKASKKSSKKTK